MSAERKDRYPRTKILIWTVCIALGAIWANALVKDLTISAAAYAETTSVPEGIVHEHWSYESFPLQLFIATLGKHQYTVAYSSDGLNHEHYESCVCNKPTAPGDKGATQSLGASLPGGELPEESTRVSLTEGLTGAVEYRLPSGQIVYGAVIHTREHQFTAFWTPGGVSHLHYESCPGH